MRQFETHDIEYIAQNSTETVSNFPFGEGVKSILKLPSGWGMGVAVNIIF